MVLEQLLEQHISGMGFLATESLFNMVLVAENRLTFHKHGISFPHDGVGCPVSGHTYPIMYFYGNVTSLIGHPVLSALHQNYDSLTAWGLFGVAFAGAAVAVETVFGKVNYAPWREVYDYIKKRVEWSFEHGLLSRAAILRKIPVTVANNSACLWLLPAWIAFASTYAYLHDAYIKCSW